jgi:nucleoside-diphosphate-sugar epimerase
MIKRLKKNEAKIDLTAGDQMRDFVYIDDIVSAYKTVLNDDVNSNYAEFSVATQQLISIKEVMNILKELSGSTTNLNFGAIPYRENELMHSLSDNSDLSALGWKPACSIQEGLIKCVEFNKDAK